MVELCPVYPSYVIGTTCAGPGPITASSIDLTMPAMVDRMVLGSVKLVASPVLEKKQHARQSAHRGDRLRGCPTSADAFRSLTLGAEEADACIEAGKLHILARPVQAVEETRDLGAIVIWRLSVRSQCLD
jgi:hypothetical protein